VIRPVRFSDLNAVRRIFISAFREEYGRRGVDIGAQVGRWQKTYPLICLLRAFPNPYRYLVNLFVLEEKGEIAGFIQTTPGNQERSRWHIDYVAVAPEFQGRGIGSRLVGAVFERYGALGVNCFTLEVDALNAPALKLYEKLCFRKYASVTYMQMEKQPAVTDDKEFAGLRNARWGDKQGLYELYLAATPAPVRLVDQRGPSDFAQGPLDKGMSALRTRLKQVADLRFVVEEKGQIVAYLRVMAQWRALPHTVQLMVHPGYQHLYPRLLTQAAGILKNYPERSILAWAPDYQLAKQNALTDWGMRPLTVDRCLVRDNLIALKLPLKESLGAQEEKVFKPAFTHEH
jgi:ribosomal protein S18 acetylase RimI-like enzyme